MSKPDWLTIGASYRERGRRYHVRGFVDNQVVVRYWRRFKQHWEYEAIPEFLFHEPAILAGMTDIRSAKA